MDKRSFESSFLIYAVLITCLFGLMPVAPNLDRSASIFDVLFLLYASVHICLRGIDRLSIFVAGAASLYLLTNFLLYLNYFNRFISPFDMGELKNFMYSNKFIFYVIVAALSAAPVKIRRSDLNLIFFVMLYSFAVKYTYLRILFGVARPTLITENNFELMMLLIFYALHLILNDRCGRERSYPVFAIVVYVVLISGSRSSALAVGAIFLFQFVGFRTRDLPIYFVVVPVVAGIIYVIFSLRASENSREIFFEIFKYEIADFSILQHLFGTVPLTPLNAESCAQVSFWKNLMSSSDDGNCYAVILHSFFMRTYFDHGIFGNIFVFASIACLLSNTNMTKKEVACILSIPFVCALSVSSFSTSFVSWPIAIICGLRIRRLPTAGKYP